VLIFSATLKSEKEALIRVVALVAVFSYLLLAGEGLNRGALVQHTDWRKVAAHPKR